MHTHADTSENLSKITLFEGEKLLVGVSGIGFLLAAVCALYMGINGAIILPEGNVANAFSFNAAIAVFILSVAAFMPLAGLSPRKRARLRWGFILTILIGYGIETVQHFRGINPRFTQSGTIADIIIGGVFGLTSLVLIVVTVRLAAAFFSKGKPVARPLIHLGIRYAFVSTMIAFAAGIVMIVLQSRYMGPAGNVIIIHGLGFHALQTLPLLGWLLERAQTGEHRARRIIHTGSIAWLVCNLLIAMQTVLGGAVFELTPLPVLAGAALLGWVITAVVCSSERLKPDPVNHARTFHSS